MRFEYPAELPISAAKEDIVHAVQSSQVVIVSGQTGSGKTTQIPKILLEMGRGDHGRQIVHTQPRRIAARTVAERIASETGTRLGDQIGYQVRFTDKSSRSTRLRVVTDGILLAQIQGDPQLRAYDTIIIDEAHERSLNIDFLLGYLTALLPKRPDLKLIITSATIDSVKFRDHFAKALHTKVPVLEVSGRTYPVQTLYEPAGSAPALMRHVPGFDSEDGQDREDPDIPKAVARACAELVIHSTHTTAPGTSWCSPPASATSASTKPHCGAISARGPPTCAARTLWRSSHSSPACRPRSSTESSNATAISASSLPPTWPKPP